MADEAETEYLLVRCRRGLVERDLTRVFDAIALLRDVDCVMRADLTGLPKARLDVVTGQPTQDAVRRRVRLAG